MTATRAAKSFDVVMSMSVEPCPQCRTPRPPGASACRKCGFAFSGGFTPEPTTGATLVLRAGGSSARTWTVGETTVEIGRSGPAAVVLPDRSVSRRHARLSRVGEDFALDDLGSKNGTFANGRPVSQGYIVADGDELVFGDIALSAEIQRPVRAAAVALGSATLLVAEPVTSVPPAPPPRQARRDDATVIEGRHSGSDAPTGPTRVRRDADPTPPPDAGVRTVVYGAEPVRPPAVPPVREAYAYPGAPIVAATPPDADRGAAGRLPELVASSDGLAASMRRLQQDLAGALWQFEQSGGRETLRAVLERLRRIESGRDTEGLTNWLPMVRGLLEAQLALVTVLAPGSADSGPRGRDELQPHAAYHERVSGPY